MGKECFWNDSDPYVRKRREQLTQDILNTGRDNTKIPIEALTPLIARVSQARKRETFERLYTQIRNLGLGYRKD